MLKMSDASGNKVKIHPFFCNIVIKDERKIIIFMFCECNILSKISRLRIYDGEMKMYCRTGMTKMSIKYRKIHFWALLTTHERNSYTARETEAAGNKEIQS